MTKCMFIQNMRSNPHMPFSGSALLSFFDWKFHSEIVEFGLL